MLLSGRALGSLHQILGSIPGRELDGRGEEGKGRRGKKKGTGGEGKREKREERRGDEREEREGGRNKIYTNYETIKM
jgi:hypothetical protein